jgi:hypothetical protein
MANIKLLFSVVEKRVVFAKDWKRRRRSKGYSIRLGISSLRKYAFPDLDRQFQQINTGYILNSPFSTSTPLWFWFGLVNTAAL